MTTTTEREAAWTAATMPYALSGLAFHLIDFHLPVPESIDIREGRITLWLRHEDVAAWRVVSNFEPETVKTGIGARRHAFEGHRALAVLHGSCAKVTFRWTTPSEAIVCTGLDDTCRNIVDETPDEPGCAHGHNLCAEHRTECDQCRDELGDDRPVMDIGWGWDR